MAAQAELRGPTHRDLWVAAGCAGRCGVNWWERWGGANPVLTRELRGRWRGWRLAAVAAGGAAAAAAGLLFQLHLAHGRLRADACLVGPTVLVLLSSLAAAPLLAAAIVRADSGSGALTELKLTGLKPREIVWGWALGVLVPLGLGYLSTLPIFLLCDACGARLQVSLLLPYLGALLALLPAILLAVRFGMTSSPLVAAANTWLGVAYLCFLGFAWSLALLALLSGVGVLMPMISVFRPIPGLPLWAYAVLFYLFVLAVSWRQAAKSLAQLWDRQAEG